MGKRKSMDWATICTKKCGYRDGYKIKEEVKDWMNVYDNAIYFSNDKTQKQQAIRLKLENMPKIVYRYRSLRDDINLENKKICYCMDEIKNDYLHLSSAKSFNDPFETIGMLSRGDFDDLFEDFESNSELDLLKMQYDFLRGEKRMWEEIEKNSGDHSMSQLLEEKCNIFQETFLGIMEKQRLLMSDYINKCVRMVCFTDNNLSLPMWAHYADNHAGVCIEYEFDNTEMANNYWFFPMRYTKDYSKVQKCISQKIEMAYLYILSRKDEAWKYEHEWRYVDFGLHGNGDKGMRCERFKIKAVYLGINCNNEKINEIMKLSVSKNFSVYKMKKTCYGLVPEQLTKNFDDFSDIRVDDCCRIS